MVGHDNDDVIRGITWNSAGSLFKSTRLMTVNAERVTWLNFHGRSITASAVYRTYPTSPSNDDGMVGGNTNVNGKLCVPAASRELSPSAAVT